MGWQKFDTDYYEIIILSQDIYCWVQLSARFLVSERDCRSSTCLPNLLLYDNGRGEFHFDLSRTEPELSDKSQAQWDYSFQIEWFII